MASYDPYTYNPMLRAYYVNSNFSNRQSLPPESVIREAENNPQAASHLYSVWGFLDWMRQSTPELYAAVSSANLADPVAVVNSGRLSPRPMKAFGGQGRTLSGLGEFENTPGVMDAEFYDYEIGSNTPDTSIGIASDWGNKIFDIAGKYLQYDTQKQLLALNLKRAEQGLPPIDSGSLAPTVNVGVSKSVQQIAYIAVGGLILVGLYSAFVKAK